MENLKQAISEKALLLQHKNRKIKLAPIVKYVEEQTGYLIYLKDRQDGRLITGTVDMRDGVRHKVAYIYFKNYTEAIHELSHIWATPGPRPTGDKALLIRELEAWRCAECLHHMFSIPFDPKVFDEGLGSYVISLVAGAECPPYECLSQLLGGEMYD